MPPVPSIDYRWERCPRCNRWMIPTYPQVRGVTVEDPFLTAFVCEDCGHMVHISSAPARIGRMDTDQYLTFGGIDISAILQHQIVPLLSSLPQFDVIRMHKQCVARASKKWHQLTFPFCWKYQEQ